MVDFCAPSPVFINQVTPVRTIEETHRKSYLLQNCVLRHIQVLKSSNKSFATGGLALFCQAYPVDTLTPVIENRYFLLEYPYVAMRILPYDLLLRLMVEWFSCDARSRKYTCAVNKKIGVAMCAVTVCFETVQAASCCEWLVCTEEQL